MHIAIEGMDGVGKTSVAKLVSEKIGYQFIEKPLHLLFDEKGAMENYIKISSYINSKDNKDLKAWFYGLGNIYLINQFKDKNIVTDRHLVSNYFWNSNEDNGELFKCLVNITGKPDLTILIYATPEARLQRILNRDPADPDIQEIDLYSNAYDKMEKFLKCNDMNYVTIDSSELNLEEVTQEAILQFQKLQLNGSPQKRRNI